MPYAGTRAGELRRFCRWTLLLWSVGRLAHGRCGHFGFSGSSCLVQEEGFGILGLVLFPGMRLLGGLAFGVDFGFAVLGIEKWFRVRGGFIEVLF